MKAKRVTQNAPQALVEKVVEKVRKETGKVTKVEKAKIKENHLHRDTRWYLPRICVPTRRTGRMHVRTQNAFTNIRESIP